MQRVTKFVKYLPQYGWDCTVLTAANPSVPIFDESLMADVPTATVVHRAKSWEPSYAVKSAVASGAQGHGRTSNPLRRMAKSGIRRVAGALLQPDPQILWAPHAIRTGQRLLTETRHSAIVASGPPFSCFVVGAALSRRTGVPLVLDYRDEWDLSNLYWENKKLNPLSLKIQGKMQRSAVRAAKAIVATTQRSAASLDRLRNLAHSGAKVSCIYNGFDPDDFGLLDAEPAEPNEHYRIAYIGTLWHLTSVAALAAAANRVAVDSPDLASRLQLVFAGRRLPLEQATLEALKPSIQVEEHEYLDHTAAIRLMRSADELCVILADVPGAERVLPAKVFEYMAAKRPILAIAPQGELWDCLKNYPQSATFAPSDVTGIAGHLRQRLEQCGSASTHSCSEPPAQFNRKCQAQELGRILEEVATPA